jgi:hypothetical protein
MVRVDGHGNFTEFVRTTDPDRIIIRSASGEREIEYTATLKEFFGDA